MRRPEGEDFDSSDDAVKRKNYDVDNYEKDH
jgi:hypothetical protein